MCSDDQRDRGVSQSINDEAGKSVLEIGVKVHIRLIDEQNIFLPSLRFLHERVDFDPERNEFRFAATDVLRRRFVAGGPVNDLECFDVVSLKLDAV